LSEVTELAGPALTYARRVGQRLRLFGSLAIRDGGRLTLTVEDVDVAALVGDRLRDRRELLRRLGAYERGERVISVPRLQRLADFYRVPVDQLLPRDSEVPTDLPSAGTEPNDMRSPSPTWPAKVTFDLARFQAVDNDPELEMVYKYLSSIQVRRQDFNGRVLTIRADDIRAIAGLFGTDADALLRRLDDLQLRLQPA